MVAADRFYATGKRKNSIARVWLQNGSGNILVTEKNITNILKDQFFN